MADGDLTGGPYEGGTNMFCLVFNKAATSFSVYVDGTIRLNTGYTAGAELRHFYVYKSWNSGLNDNPDGAVGEMILTKSVSTDNRQLIEGYLAHKWGIHTQLPNDHPLRWQSPWIGFRGTVISLQ